MFTEQNQQPTGCEHKHYPKIYKFCLYFILLGSVNTSAYQKRRHLTQHFKILQDVIPFPGVNDKDEDFFFVSKWCCLVMFTAGEVRQNTPAMITFKRKTIKITKT